MQVYSSITSENMPAMSVLKVAERLAVSPKTIYRLVSNGELGCIRVGRAVRVTESQLNEYVARQGE